MQILENSFHADQVGVIDQNGEWRPNKTIQLSPLYANPFSIEALKWFLHRNFVGFGPYFLTAMLVYFYLQPGPENFKSLQFWPIAWMYFRNVSFMLIVYGGWHLALYTFKLNGSRQKYDSKWQNIGHSQFKFKNQVWDNMFHSLVYGAGFWTMYEVAYYWCMAHDLLPMLLNFHEYPVLFVMQLLLIPFWRAFHFYWIHRFLHWKPMYTRFHSLHHKNVNIGPWSGMAMHPVEALGYISCVLIHWVIPSHPIHFFYNMILTTITPASAHTGFEGEVLDGRTSTGDLTHYLHHRYFHYNFGDMNGLPMDYWCGTLHDGSKDFEVKLPYEIKENETYNELTSERKEKISRVDSEGVPYKIWQCTLCAFVYDEALGLPEEGFAPGTRWEDIPEDWECPDCGLSKSDFDMIELNLGDSQTPSVKGKKKIVIVGSGLGGYTVAKELRKLDAASSIILITKDAGRNYSKPMLSNAVSAGKSAGDLVLKSPEQMAEELNVHLRTGTMALEIDREHQQLLTDGGVVDYDELVLALGAEQIVPKILGNAKEEICTINHLDHFKKFQKKLNGPKRILIMGGGLIGCEFANDLVMAGHQVHVVDMASSPLQRQVPAQVGSRLQNALGNVGTEWHFNKTLNSMDHVSDHLHCRLSDGEVLQADLVLSAIGLIPNLELAKSSGLEVNRGIVVDDYLRTNDPHIYAIGDCSEHDKKVLPFVLPITYGSSALAKTLCGQDTKVQYPLMPIVVKTPTMPICMLPAPENLEGEWEINEQPESTAAKYIDDQGRLRGFILMGKAIEQKNAYLELMHNSEKCA